MSAALAANQIDIVVRELATVGDRLLDAAHHARALAAATDWQSTAARAFHTASETWAAEVGRLASAAETARLAACRAKDAAFLLRGRAH
ncbi:hypothetical protein OB08_02545 [Microbacterium sp. HJ5]